MSQAAHYSIQAFTAISKTRADSSFGPFGPIKHFSDENCLAAALILDGGSKPKPSPSPKGRRNNVTAASLAFGRSFGERHGEFLALMEVSELIPNPIRENQGRPKEVPSSSSELRGRVENLLAEFEVFRSAVIDCVERDNPAGVRGDSARAYLADICVRRFNQSVAELEAWRSSQIVGYSAQRLRAEARESELNRAIVEVMSEDFLLGNFDLNALLILSLERFYSEDVVLWLGDEESSGRRAAFERVAGLLEPIHTLLEMGLGHIESFEATADSMDGEGGFVTDWQAILGGTYCAGKAVYWRTIRMWKDRVVVAERMEGIRIAPL